jgi:hypothetical protein
MKNTNLIIIAVLTLIIGAGTGFFGGMKYQENQRPAFVNRQLMVNQSNNGNRMMGNGFRPVAGEIIAVGDNTITVKLNNGSSKIVMLSPTTAINKAATASAADLITGATVAVFGQTNADGSVAAQSVQINPEFKGQTR